MLEAHVIQTKGFKNVGEGDASGFQVTVRCPYYRGIWASLIEDAELTVDGETFGSDSVSWTLGRASYSTAELAESDDATLGVRGAGDPHRRQAGRPRARPPRRPRRRHLAMVVHPGRDAADDEHLVAEAGARPMTPAASDITFGVSLYSYGGDFLVTMSLEDCLADVADMGATDLEILADTHIPGYPTPSTEWVDHWHALLERHALVPTCYSSWLDTRLYRDRALTVDEAVAILTRDLELAHRLGFTSLRPKLGVVSLDLVPDPIWRETVETRAAARRRSTTSGSRPRSTLRRPSVPRSSRTTSTSCARPGRGTSGC